MRTITCPSCGIHFPNEFKSTLKPDCTYWVDFKMGDLPNKARRQVWKWLFSCPILTDYGFTLSFEYNVLPSNAVDWNQYFPGFSALPPDRQQTLLKEYYKAEDKVAFIKNRAEEMEKYTQMILKLAKQPKVIN